MNGDTIYADIVAEIPQHDGGTRYQRVGTLVRHSDPNAVFGPGFTVVLDRTFNHSALPGEGSTVGLSVRWPKSKDNAPPFGAARVKGPEGATIPGRRVKPGPDFDDLVGPLAQE